MSSGRYVDLIANRAVIKTQNGFDGQKFVLDWKKRCVKSVLNNNCLDARRNWIYTDASNNEWYQHFKFDGTYFVNIKTKKVFDVDGGKDEEG